MGGFADGIGAVAHIAGSAAMTIDATGIWLGDGAARTIRRIDIATKAVTTVAGNVMAGMGYVDSPMGANARFGSVEALFGLLWARMFFKACSSIRRQTYGIGSPAYDRVTTCARSLSTTASSTEPI